MNYSIMILYSDTQHSIYFINEWNNVAFSYLLILWIRKYSKLTRTVQTCFICNVNNILYNFSHLNNFPY